MNAADCLRLAAVVAVVAATAANTSASITIATVAIGNVGNPSDPSTGYGGVPYEYRIGTTEVTNAQYAEFLNAVARTDTFGLYDASMGDIFLGGIVRSGASGSYSYSIQAGRGSRPVTWVTYWDAIRFTNWLHNGQPTGAQGIGTTESGAYTLTPSGISANSVSRNVGWKWALPTENEWYKAAYYQPASLGGDVDGYWRYPTGSNGDPFGQAAYGGGVLRDVGSFAPNFYGTFDMGGNVTEWTMGIASPGTRVRRGGSVDTLTGGLLATSRSGVPTTFANASTGFRVVQIPSAPTAAAAIVGVLVGSVRRRR